MSCREGCSLWSRGSWLGGSLVSALSFVASCTLQVAHGVFVVFSLLSCIMGLRNMTHKLSSACAEMILSYHLLPQQIFFTHYWNLTRHFRVVVCFLVCLLVCVLCGLFLPVLVFCVVFAFGSCASGFCFFWTWPGNRTMYRSSTSCLLRPYSLGPCVNQLINLHMQHDWTHVERPGESHTALDGKKSFCISSPIFFSFEFGRCVEKAPCTDPRSDSNASSKIPTELRGADAYVNHAHQTQAQRGKSLT